MLWYLDVGHTCCKLLILVVELLGLGDNHLVDEIGLPELFVVGDALMVLGGFYVAMILYLGVAYQSCCTRRSIRPIPSVRLWC